MKCAKLRRRRSMMAVVVLLAAGLLFSFAAKAAPRGAEEAVRGTSKSGSEVTRLVTGDPAQINAVVAGTPPTAILAINPVPVPAGVTPPNPYPLGTTIIGNELRAEVGGFRAWFNVQVSDWDPLGNGPNALVYQVKIDCTNYKGETAVPPNPGVDIAPAAVECFNNQDCQRAFGETWARYCFGGFCEAGYLDSIGYGRPDSWCAPSGGYCHGSGVSISTCNYRYFAQSDAIPIPGHPDQPRTCTTGARIGQGCTTNADCYDGNCDGPKLPNYYGGTLVLDIPAAARGKYTVNLNQDETFIVGAAAPPVYFVYLESLAETGFVVNIGLGQCCYGLGTPEEGCVDGVLRSECDAEPGPVVFTWDERCPPDGPDCGRFQGACCDTLLGQCEDEMLEADCQGTHRVWTSGTSCGDTACIADTGACCDHDPFGPCDDDTVSSDCRCATCTWYKLQACADLDCVPTPIPAISEWGLAILTLLLLTAAKIYFGRRAGEPRFAAPQ